MQILIEPMRTEHVAGAAAVEYASFSTPWSADSFHNELSLGYARYYVALCEDTVIGFGGVHCIVDTGYITNIATLSRMRRKGVGSMLLDALINCCRERSMREITLEVRVCNSAAIDMYKRAGFVIVGTRPRYYERPIEDAYIMTLDLS